MALLVPPLEKYAKRALMLLAANVTDAPCCVDVGFLEKLPFDLNLS